MPGMPEVETIRRGLEATVRGARIESVEVRWRPFVVATRRLLDAVVVGHRIGAVRRRGKALILDLDGDWHLLVHPRMTGQVVVHRHGRLVAFGGHPTRNVTGPMPNAWTRAVFTLSAGRVVYVNNQRKFARIRVLTGAGLTLAHVRRLYRSIGVMLEDAVEHAGATWPDFIDDGRHHESYREHARLFGHQGRACVACGTRIERIRVASRGTNICPHCQRRVALRATANARPAAAERKRVPVE